MIGRLIRKMAGTPDELMRRIQMGGLVRTARLAANVVDEEPPRREEMPIWIDEIFVTVGGRMCRYDDEQMPAPDECDALEAARDFLAGMPAETRLEFQSLLVLLEMSPYVFGPRRDRLTALRGEEQDIVLQGWEQSPLVPKRTGFRAVKSVIMMGYWSRPATWGAIGYSVADNPGVPQPQRDDWKRREDRT